MNRGERATKGPGAASAWLPGAPKLPICAPGSINRQFLCSREQKQAISRSRLLHLCPSPRFCNQEAEIQSAKEELERRRKITHELQHKLKIAKAALEEQQGITETGCACEKMCVCACMCVCVYIQRERERERERERQREKPVVRLKHLRGHMHECVTSKHDGADLAPELSQPPPQAYLYNTFGNHPRS